MIKRIGLILLAGVLLLVGATVLAFRFSPWPSVLIIQHAFSQGERESEAALEKYVPPNVLSQYDISYGPHPSEVLDIHNPSNTEGPNVTVVWVHGGAWVAGTKSGMTNYLKVFSGHGVTTVGVEYATGRGVKYPGPVEQVNRALDYLVENAKQYNIDPNRIVLAGDSAGAQIAAQLAIVTTDAEYAEEIGIAPELRPDQLASVLLLSGAFDVSQVDFDSKYGWFVRSILWAYTGTKNFMDDDRFRLASVTHYVTPSFPPTFISSGNGDPLEAQALALSDKLEALGVEVESLFFGPDYRPLLSHEYQFNLDIAAGQLALERMLAFLDAFAPEVEAAKAQE